jgi:hypothetical protein
VFSCPWPPTASVFDDQSMAIHPRPKGLVTFQPPRSGRSTGGRSAAVGAGVGGDTGGGSGIGLGVCFGAAVGVEAGAGPGLAGAGDAAGVFGATTANSTTKTAPDGSLTHNFPDASTKRVRPVAGVATDAAGTGVKFNPETGTVVAWPVVPATGGSAAGNGRAITRLRTTMRILIG